MQEKYNEFIRVAICLNKKLSITPLLYGSLGLQQLVVAELFPEDIDILVQRNLSKKSG